NHAARTRECGGKVGAVLRTEQIVDTRDGIFHFRGPIVQVAKQCLSLGIQVIELCRQSVEVDILLRREQGTAYRPRCMRAAGKNLDVVVSQGAHAHDLYAAVALDGKVGLHAEDDVQPFGVLRVELHALDAAYIGTSCVAHGRSGLKSAREGKVCVKLCCGASKGAAHGEHGGKQHGHGDEHEHTYERLLTFRLHHCPLFPAVLWGR